MKKLTFFASLLAIFSLEVSANPADLLKKAKEAGLMSLPEGKELIQYQNKKIEDLKIGYKPLMTKDQIELGKKLFFDPRLSNSNLISCNTCHNLGLAGVDLVPTAHGNKWQPNPSALNSPTVYNSVFNNIQFWDGRSHDLGDQAQGPIQNPVEMAATPNLVVEKINSMPEYVNDFKKAYGNNVKITFKLITDTIAIFEATLVTPSRYDDFLNGNVKALSKEEQEGLALFIDKGCTACHNGINLGGTMQPFGVVKPYEFAKVGGFKGDKNGMVKVPTLRNITETMPYFHNGQYWDVKDAIKEMGAIQLGIQINHQEAQKIEAFFESLTGSKPQIVYPQLPRNGANTPKPQL